MTWPEALPLDKTEIGFVDNFDDIQEFMRWLGQKRDVLALDTETAGLDPYASNARIRLFQCGDVNTAYVIDAQKWPGLIHEVLEKYEGPQVWHNIAFDAKYIQTMLPQLKFPWMLSHDTMLMARLNDNEGPAGLKPLSERLFGGLATAGQRMLDATMENTKTDWNTVPLDAPAFRMYSGVDVILTARLYREMNHIHSGEFKRVYDLEMEARRICSKMELKGMQLDHDYCLTKRTELTEFVDKSLQYTEKKYGINIMSAKQLGDWLVAEGADIQEYTATGRPKVDEDNLTYYSKVGYEIADYALKARKANKIVSSYLDNFIKFSENSGGIVHPQIKTMAAKTGRMSITDPALQTLSRTETTVRGCFVPHEGDVLLSCDLDQVELRLAGALSHDPQMISDFSAAARTGIDFFTNSGRSLYSDPSMIKGDPRRDTVKTYWYSSLYGAGVQKMAMSAGVPVSQMRDVAQKVKLTYTELEKFKTAIVSRCETMSRDGERPYINTYTGRRLYVPETRMYAAVNYLIQSTAAEVFKYNLIDMDYSGLSDFLCVPVHDEILLSVPHETGLVEEVRETVKECMTNDSFDIPLTTECSAPMTRWKKA